MLLVFIWHSWPVDEIWLHSENPTQTAIAAAALKTREHKAANTPKKCQPSKQPELCKPAAKHHHT
jgi:hypothetical protein